MTNANDIVTNILPDENVTIPTDKELHNMTLDAIRWEVRKATYMLLDVDSYFHLRPDELYPDNQTLDAIRLNYQKMSAELDILNGILGRIFDLAEHDDDEGGED